jgi:hypothetical protein
MERVLTFHTQEVRGSSPCAPTISESSWPRVFLFQSIKMRTSITTGVVRFVGSLALPAQIGDFCFGLGNLLHEFEQAVGDGGRVLRNERFELLDKAIGRFQGSKGEFAANAIFQDVVF